MLVGLASDEPQRLVSAKNAEDLEEAFIAYMTDEIERQQNDDNSANVFDSSSSESREDALVVVGEPEQSSGDANRSWFRLNRMLAYSYRESLEIMRDPVRLVFAFIGSALLMFVFGFGVTMDVNEIEFAVLDQDRTPESLDYADALVGSRYFRELSPIYGKDDMQRRLKDNDITIAIEIPPNYGRELKRGGRPQVFAWIDGANPSRAATIEGYVQGVHAKLLEEIATDRGEISQSRPVEIVQRFRYNPSFESIFAMVPSVPAILLVLIPAILMAVSVVKEKELGSITNFYVTPTSRLEFLIGKQLPYIVIGMLNFFLLTALAIFLFGVPLHGSGWMLTLCALAYVTATTGIGLFVSSFTSSQVAAVFVTTIVTILPSIQFSGLTQPVSTLEGGAHWMGVFWPTTYYMHASVGAFAKSLSASELLSDFLALVAFVPALISP